MNQYQYLGPSYVLQITQLMSIAIRKENEIKLTLISNFVKT